MFKFISIALISLLMVGCSLSPSSEEVSDGAYNPENNSYYQDSRTKLCFAAASYSRFDSSMHKSNELMITNVPCTPEVMNLIHR